MFLIMKEVDINSHLTQGQELLIYDPQPGGDKTKLVKCIFDDKVESIKKLQVKHIGMTWAVTKAYLPNIG